MSRNSIRNKTVILLIGCFSLFSIMGVNAQTNGMTGFSQSGATCHSSTADPTLTVAVNGIPPSYSPGSDYALSIAVTGGPTGGGGFDLSVTGGSLSTTDLNVKIINNEAINANGDHRSWAVSWRAPQVGSGSVTFYVAGLASDDDGSALGDSWNVNTYTSTEGASGQAPAAPSNLAASVAGAGAIDLTWEANTESDLEGYRIYRSLTPEGPYVMLNPEALIASTNYVDDKLEGGHTYYYTITASTTSGGESPKSNEASVFVQPATVNIENTTYGLTWILFPVLSYMLLLALTVILFKVPSNKNKIEEASPPQLKVQ